MISSSEKGILPHPTEKHDVINALTPLRKRPSTPMSSSASRNDIIPQGIMASQMPLNTLYAPMHAPWCRTPTL